MKGFSQLNLWDLHAGWWTELGKLILFISTSTNSGEDMGDISHRISHGGTVSSPLLVNNWFGIYLQEVVTEAR